MKQITGILKGQRIFMVSLTVAAMVLLWLAPKAAVNVDELLHYPHAQKVVNWYFTLGSDQSCLDTPVDNLKYYGQSVDNLTALINRVLHIENEYLIRHFTGAFFFWLLLVFAGLLGKEITGNKWVPALVVLSLMLTPRLFGQAFGNLKDIPFATGYVAGLLFIIRFLKEFPYPRWRTGIFLALAIAFTNSVRIGGLILFAYLGLGILILLFAKPFLLKYIFSTKSCFVRLTGQLLFTAIAGYFLGLLFWPFALQNVWLNPIESLSVMEHYKISIKQIFESDVVWSSQLPRSYLLRWFWISTPEFLLVGLIYFIAFLTLKFTKPGEQLFMELFALFALVFPVVYVIVIRSNLYSGIRQMLFVVPVLVVLSVTGFYRMIGVMKTWRSKLPYLILFFGLMVLPLIHQARTFPVDYVYFNAINGGTRKAWSNYEYDYYFHGMKEAADFLLKEIGDDKVIVAMNCQLPNYFENTPNVEFQYTRYLERSSKDWDYGLFGVNYIHPWQMKHNTWQSSKIVKTFYHRGNPLVVLLKRGEKNDLAGIETAQKGDWAEGEALLRKALKDDPNNVWIFVNLANLKLAQGKYAEVEEWLQKGRELYPFYEPFYYIEAQQLYNSGKYAESCKVLNELVAVNPFYTNAAPLLKKVKEKLNINQN